MKKLYRLKDEGVAWGAAWRELVDDGCLVWIEEAVDGPYNIIVHSMCWHYSKHGHRLNYFYWPGHLLSQILDPV